MTTERLWYYAPHRQRTGPVAESALRALAASGSLPPDTLVWTQGMAQWAPLASVPDLAPPPSTAFATPPPVLPASTPGGVPAPSNADSDAMTALVFSIVGLASTVICCIPLVFSIVGVILGHRNLARPGLTPAARDRNRLALVLGYLGIAITLVFPILLFLTGMGDAVGEWFRQHGLPGSRA